MARKTVPTLGCRYYHRFRKRFQSHFQGIDTSIQGRAWVAKAEMDIARQVLPLLELEALMEGSFRFSIRSFLVLMSYTAEYELVEEKLIH